MVRAAVQGRITGWFTPARAFQALLGKLLDAPSGRTDSGRRVGYGQGIGLQSQFGKQHGGLERPYAMPFHVPGIGQDLTGRPLLDDTPLVHQQDPVRAQDVFGLVLHQDDALDLVPQDLGELEDVALADGVQVGRRFVHDDHRGTARKHRGDGQPLLLASRQAGGVPLFEARQADPVQGLFDAGFHLIAVHGEVLERESRLELHVGGEQLCLEVLEDQADDSCQFVDLGPFGIPVPGYLQASLEPALCKGGD